MTTQKSKIKRHGGLCAPEIRNDRPMSVLPAIFLSFAFFLFIGSLFAQKVTLHENKTPIVKVLEKIREQTHYSFFYNKSIGLEKNNVTINVENAFLKDVLGLIFNNLKFKYTLANRTIVITRKLDQESISDKILMEGTLPDIRKIRNFARGRVFDDLGQPLENIMVEDFQTGLYTFTDKNGEFALPEVYAGIIVISGYGYLEQEVPYKSEPYLIVRLKSIPVTLKNVRITSTIKKDPNRFVDLKNRAYMNLGQVLQGTVPGLSLQVVNTTSTSISSIDVLVHNANGFVGVVNMTKSEFLNYEPTQGQAILDALLSGNVPSYLSSVISLYKLHTTTSVTNALVPQIRGANSFINSTNGLLVVIDGFPKDGFPSDYPMSNVESIEVVKDPQELIKWGSRAAGGAIIIKTKSAKGGPVQMNYSSNFYYAPSPRFNRSYLQLASTADLLDYLRESDSLYPVNYSASTFNLSAAARLLANRRNQTISDVQFNNSWDSLSHLDNTSQLKLLQQNAFSMNHTLSMLGGNRYYHFSIIGAYSSTQNNDLEGFTRQGNLSMNNSFNLLHDNLHIDWYLYYSKSHSRLGYSLSPANSDLQPYQMLLDNKGQYIYDYTTLSQDANRQIMNLGYHNYGVNLLQDARLNKNTSDLTLKQSRVNMDWKLLPEISLLASVYYTEQITNSKNLYDKNSSYVRQFVDRYGQLASNGVIFYVPFGDILQSNRTLSKEWNVRTGLTFHKSFGRHDFNASLGGGGASVVSRQPATTVKYGYNSKTKTASPLFLPTPNPSANITNFYSLFQNTVSTENPYSLTVPVNGDSSISRSLNWNASLGYRFADFISVTGQYNAALNPTYGQKKTYSVLSTYRGDVTAMVLKHSGKALLQNLSLSAGMNGTVMPNLIAQYSNSRYQQVVWNNYTIWVSGATPTQLTGQSSYNYYQGMTLSMAEGRYAISLNYNTQHMTGALSTTTSSSSSASSDSSSTIHYLSATAKILLRQGLLSLGVNYSKSPEGQSQINGDFHYDIAKDTYFQSKIISTLEFDGTVQNISPYQGLGIMMGTNVSNGSGFSMATNNSYSLLPSKTTNIELRGKIGILQDLYSLDLRYYNRTTAGLSNNISVASDPSSGISSQISYSDIINKGVEFYLKADIVHSHSFSYNLTINGAYNVNIAKRVPKIPFTVSNSYPVSYREGYNTSNIWSYKWAGLDNNGNPRIYDAKGNITTQFDSATLSNSLSYSGVTKAPWTGGLIHEFLLGPFFSRISMVFNWGYVMRRYIPSPSGSMETSVLIKNRWRKAGDEKVTDVPAFSSDGAPGTARAYVVQNSTNSIMSADNVRLQEIMFGWNGPQLLVKRLGLKSLIFTIQVENAYIWTRNKLHLDPTTVSTTGVVGLPIARQFAGSLNIGF